MIYLFFIISLTFAIKEFDLTQLDSILFEEFIQEFNKQYSSETEKNERFVIFKETLQEIRESNSKRKSEQDAISGINFFSDMKVSEMNLNFQPSTPPIKQSQMKGKVRLPTFPDKQIPEQYFMCSSLTQRNTDRPKIDFCTTQIYQGTCGNCYAATPANAAQFYYSNLTYYFNDKKAESVKPRQFTPQRWMDKVEPNTGTKRCCGGSSYWALHAEPTFTFLEDYPYADQNSGTSVCTKRGDQNATVAIQMRLQSQPSFSVEDNTTPEGILALKKMMYFYGPLNVNIKGDATGFKNYRSGIYTFPDGCAKQTSNHLVALMGYGNDNGEEFFLAKNSWYKGWGFEENYIKISTKRLCNIAYCPWENGNCENYYYNVGSCLLDKNCDDCDKNSLACVKCKEGSTKDHRGMCVSPKDAEPDTNTNNNNNNNTNTNNTNNNNNNNNSTNTNKKDNAQSIFSLMITFIVVILVSFMG